MLFPVQNNREDSPFGYMSIWIHAHLDTFHWVHGDGAT